ncbi:hypothetical protein C1645_820531 [Glomus cerebriforme]|uniref:Uncharacterized protein n=1 Tax=Glomus cerebriforme TaxID=658196 RepID=A0A397T5J8_9GLOM|nr:hypothetical protein C1645_820531 [Glomus cerebriforme]
MKFTHLYIPPNFNHRFSTRTTGAKQHCFAEIEFLRCCTKIDDNILDNLIGISFWDN